MKCPKCGKGMVQGLVGGTTISACDSCNFFCPTESLGRIQGIIQEFNQRSSRNKTDCLFVRRLRDIVRDDYDIARILWLVMGTCRECFDEPNEPTCHCSNDT